MELFSQLSLKAQQQDPCDLLDFTSDLFIAVSDNEGLIYFCKTG